MLPKPKATIFAYSNPDTVVAEDTFTKALAFAKRQKDLGIVGVKLIDGTGNFLPECKRGTPTPLVAFTKITGLYKIFPKTFGKYYAQHLSENETGKVEILVGAFMLMKRELYTEIGGFDENCFDVFRRYRFVVYGFAKKENRIIISTKLRSFIIKEKAP